ncbi:preprotein translocase, SecE subunit [Burkholderia pseudomallei TSV44]|nr:preprotein translocase, SecE subunit [Burkholderia pseudomallei TSV44]
MAVGVIAGVGVALMSLPGKSFIAFAKDSYREVRKVVWPTRKEATQTTLVVFGFVLVMALFLWVSDKSIEWAIFSVILGWK